MNSVNDAPTVSVIIPAYNRVKYITFAIDSVLAQTYTDFEIIVIDDGSTDNTEDVVRTYKDDRIKYIKQKNSGVSAARNHGILESKGEYIALLDSDDEYYPTRLEKTVKILKENPDISLVYSDAYYGNSCNDPNQHGCLENKNPDSGDIYKLMLHGNILPTSSLLIRKNIFNTAGLFDITLRRVEDYDLGLRICRIAKCHYIPEILILTRDHQERLTGSYHSDENLAYSLEQLTVRWQNDPVLAEFFTQWGTGQWVNLSQHYRTSGDFKKAILYLKKARYYGFNFIRSTIIIFILRFFPFIFRWYDSIFQK